MKIFVIKSVKHRYIKIHNLYQHFENIKAAKII